MNTLDYIKEALDLERETMEGFRGEMRSRVGVLETWTSNEDARRAAVREEQARVQAGKDRRNRALTWAAGFLVALVSAAVPIALALR